MKHRDRKSAMFKASLEVDFLLNFRKHIMDIYLKQATKAERGDACLR